MTRPHILTSATAVSLLLTACAAPHRGVRPAPSEPASTSTTRPVATTPQPGTPRIATSCFTDGDIGSARRSAHGDAASVARVFASTRAAVLERAPHDSALADGVALWAATRAALRVTDVDGFVAGATPPLPTPRRQRALAVVAEICTYGLAAVWPPRE